MIYDKFTCEDCGELDYVLIDGYNVGDRVLEDVKFVFYKLKNGDTILAENCILENGHQHKWEEDSYLKTLNKEYWLKQITDFGSPNPDMYEFECPKCGDSDCIS